VVGIRTRPPCRDGKWLVFFYFFDFFVCFVDQLTSRPNAVLLNEACVRCKIETRQRQWNLLT